MAHLSAPPPHPYVVNMTEAILFPRHAEAIVGRWFTEFLGKICNLGVVDEPLRR
jgi:hypothetical protein